MRDRVFTRVRKRAPTFAFTNQNAKIAREQLPARRCSPIRATLKLFTVSGHAKAAGAGMGSLRTRHSAMKPCRNTRPVLPLSEPAIHHVRIISSRPRFSRHFFVILPQRALRPLFPSESLYYVPTQTGHRPGCPLPRPRRPWI